MKFAVFVDDLRHSAITSKMMDKAHLRDHLLDHRQEMANRPS